MLMRTALLLTLLTVTHINFTGEEKKGTGVDTTPRKVLQQKTVPLAIPGQRKNPSLSNSLTHYSPPIDHTNNLLTVCSYAALATRSGENSPRDPRTTY